MSKKRDYKAEKEQGAQHFVERVQSIAENKEVIANGRTDTEWILVAHALLNCPLPYRPTKEPKITKRTRLADGRWVSVTYAAVRDKVAMPYGMDGRFMHWLIDRAVQAGRAALARGEEPSREVTWNSTYDYLRDIGVSDGQKNYRTTRASFQRLAGLAIVVEYETATGERGKIIPFLDDWHLPKTIDPEGQQALDIDRYGFIISKTLFDQAMKHLVHVPRQLWRNMKGNPQRGALLLWAYYRASAAQGPSTIPWATLRAQFWYDESNPWRIKNVMVGVAIMLHSLWPGAYMTVVEEGVKFDRASEPFLLDDSSRGRVRRL